MSRTLGYLSKLNKLLLHPQSTVHSGFDSEISRKCNGEKLETNEDRSQNDSLPEVGYSNNQSAQNFDLEELSYKFSSETDFRILNGSVRRQLFETLHRISLHSW